jgi:putative FmdB family regulatory protein
MITYDYRCESCGRQFEFRRSITEELIEECPECHGKLALVISGGSGFMVKGNSRKTRSEKDCSLESSGKTCCGRDESCGKPPCGT